ncbi:MAG: hypothetical protein M1818_005301 [Claussenomyces sp. TS43310]|nr:MAG: hypothetical protein M1818_005301 [Claussenomyces sp. TS43310]
MLATRSFARSVRAARTPAIRTTIKGARLESTQAVQKDAVKAGGSSGLVGGLVGGGLVFVAGYGYYHMSGAKTVVNAASATEKQFKKITQSMREQTPEPNELLKWFRQTVSQYAMFVPGAKSYVDSAFNDLDKIEQKHRGEVDKIVSKAYNDLKSVTSTGLSVETAQKSWAVLEDALNQLAGLAVDSASEILDNHPDLKEKVGGNLDHLQSLANSYGPEAKKQLDETYGQIKDLVAGGIGASTIPKIKKLIDEKTEQMKQLGEQAWSKGMEEAKPYLDKNPKVKELVEKNQDVLKSSNLSELWEKIQSNNEEDIQQFVKSAGEKAKGSGMGSLGGLGKDAEKYIKMIPGGSEIIPKLQKLQEVAKKHGDDAERLMKETYKEVSDVLQKKTAEAEKLADSAKKDAKK